MHTLRHLILATPALVIVSCVQPTGLSYQPTQSPQERAANEAYINKIDDQNYARADRDRMSQARATEMATRHAPTHVTTNSTNVLVW